MILQSLNYLQFLFNLVKGNSYLYWAFHRKALLMTPNTFATMPCMALRSARIERCSKCTRTFLHPRGQQGVYCYSS